MILLIGGTTEAREFSEWLNENKIDYFYCAASSTGASLINNKFISSKELTLKELKDLIKANGITHIYDLTHPYAKEIKRNASQASEELGIPYIFYSRPSVYIKDKRILYFNSMNEIVEYCSKSEGNVFLTTGCNNLKYWKSFDKNRLFVRTLPTIKSIQKCNELKVIPKNIIAEFGPFSYEENLLQCKRLHIKQLVTKESGDTGGYTNKIRAALDLNITPLVLLRPNITSNMNGITFTDLNDLKQHVQQEFN